jgi:beta-glucosidase
MSDWYGTKSTNAALEAGLDLEMPGPSVFRGARLTEAFNRKEISEKTLDAAVTNVLAMIDRTATSHSDKEEKSRVCDQTKSVALRTAAEGMVLLKNDNNMLPLKITDDLKVALIGAAAIKPSMTGGGSACAKPQYVKTPLQCFQNACKDRNQVSFSYGVNPHHAVPIMPVGITQSRDGTPGFNVDYFLDDSEKPVLSEHIEKPVVVMLGKLKPGLTQTGFYYVMETTVTVNNSGNHKLAVQATGDFALSIDGAEVSLIA